MLFHSYPFTVFAFLFFGVFFLVRRTNNLRFSFIVCASFVFYGWWDWRYLILLILSGLTDFFAAYFIGRSGRFKKIFLLGSILVNLGILFMFKYLIWVADILTEMAGGYLGVELQLAASIPPFMKTLPLGISFYTFQSLSYTIDVYRGRLTPTRNVLLFFCYLSLFPQLVAGPIVRARSLIPQLEDEPRVSDTDIFAGLGLVARGFFKKTVLADSLAPFVDTAFSSTNLATGGCVYWWLSAAAFAVQIYCDFSGYSDIAIGLGRWMGLRFPTNFDHPYISGSLREFWTRWHISLSTWFRDYVYVTLGGSRGSKTRAHLNMWITMLLSALWHGAAWHFIFWGGWHALCLSLERLFKRPLERYLPSVGVPLTTALTLGSVMLGWIFFRSDSVGSAYDIISRMLNPHTLSFFDFLRVPESVYRVLAIVVGWELYAFAKIKRGMRFRLVEHWVFESAVIATLLTIYLFYRGPGDAFIYFQF